MSVLPKSRSIAALINDYENLLANPATPHEPHILTENGDAQETLALLKILALGQEDIAAGRVRPAADVLAEIRTRIENRK